jgi:phage tail-like protein
MNTNGTKFHLLLDAADWRRCQGLEADAVEGLAWNPGLRAVTLPWELSLFLAGKGDRTFTPADRRGAAADRHGNIYWIAEDERQLLVRSAATGRPSVYWNPSPALSPERRTPVRQGQIEPEREVRAELEFGAPAAGDFAASEQPPARKRRLAGVAVTEDHLLVVGVFAPAGLLVFDLHSSSPPREIRWPANLVFRPFDLAARAGGGVWVLDREDKRVWELDATLAVVRNADPLAAAPEFHVAGEIGPTASAAISAEDSWPLGGGDPVAVEGLPDGSVLLLNYAQAFAEIRRYSRESGVPVLAGQANLEAFATHLADERPEGWQMRGHDFVFARAAGAAAGEVQGRLLVLTTDGNQAFALRLAVDAQGFHADAEAGFYPLRLCEGQALVAAPRGTQYRGAGDWFPLVEQPRAEFEREGSLTTPVFDGRKSGCVWHRLMLDACFPPGTRVEVESRAADSAEADLEAAPWCLQPTPVARADGSELPLTPSGGPGWQTHELLFQPEAEVPDAAPYDEWQAHAERGRFLQVRLTLHGTGRASPRVRALRAWYPRYSYLHEYLPAVFREEDAVVRAAAGGVVPGRFLERFLALFEGSFTNLEDRLDAVRALFDPRTVSAEALDWLAGWMGIVFNPGWEERRRRLFLRHASEFFVARGTPRGLQMVLRLAFDPEPSAQIFRDCTGAAERAGDFRIVEGFRAAGSDPAARQSAAHRFTVLLPAPARSTTDDPELLARREFVRRIVDLEKPAHTVFEVRFDQMLFRVGRARLGPDTVLGPGSQAPDFLAPLILDQGFFGTDFLATDRPADSPGRLTVGDPFA